MGCSLIENHYCFVNSIKNLPKISLIPAYLNLKVRMVFILSRHLCG